MSKFLCTSCGACCTTDMVARGALQHGLPIKKDGTCANLIGKLCSIYDDRPDCCRVDKPNLIISNKKKYFKNITKECHKLIDKAGLDDSYKVDLKDYD